MDKNGEFIWSGDLKMVVLYSTDENYSKICYSSLHSLLENNKDVDNIDIYIIDNNLGNLAKKNFERIASKYNRNIKFISCEKVCNKLIKNNDYPISSYARLFIQNEIDSDKVIYIDCDTIVNKNIEGLWNIKLGSNLIGGVIDPLPGYLKTVINLKKDDYYINAGVLLINLKLWRKEDFAKKVIDFIGENNFNVVHHDQGIINYLCKNKIKIISPCYNLMPELIYMNSNKIKKLYRMNDFYDEGELTKARKSPYIIHYISKFYNRPWYRECTHPYKDIFIKYYEGAGGALDKKPLSNGNRIRKVLYEKFPFGVFLLVERILDIRRQYKLSAEIKK